MALFVAIILILIPLNILSWEKLQQKIPWGVLILIGGGFVIAEGATETGFSALLGKPHFCKLWMQIFHQCIKLSEIRKMSGRLGRTTP